MKLDKTVLLIGTHFILYQDDPFAIPAVASYSKAAHDAGAKEHAYASEMALKMFSEYWNKEGIKQSSNAMTGPTDTVSISGKYQEQDLNGRMHTLRTEHNNMRNQIKEYAKNLDEMKKHLRHIEAQMQDIRDDDRYSY